MQVNHVFLTAAIVLLTEAVISMLARGITEEIKKRKQIRSTERWILTRGTNGYIGGEYVKEAE